MQNNYFFMNLIWKKYKKNSDLLKTKYLEVYLAENKKGKKVLIQKLISNKIDEEIKNEKKIKIIEIIKNKSESYIIIEYDPKILTHYLIGPIYSPFTREENKILSSKLKYAYCFILDDQYRETGKIGYFIKFKIKNFPIKLGLFTNFIDVEKAKTINFKYENKNQVINLSSKRKRYFSCKFEYFLIEIINNDNIKDYIVYDENLDCCYKNKNIFLSKEVIRMSFENKIYSKNEIVDIENKGNTLYNFEENDIIKLNLNKLDTDKSFIILLNLKEKNYPIIGNNLFRYKIIENVKKQYKYSLLSHSSTISIKNIKIIEEKGQIGNFQILNNGNISILFRKSNSDIYLNIYNQNLQLENKITFNYKANFARHKLLNNDNIILLFNSPIIIKLNKESKNKYDIIQTFPEEEILKKDACQCKDYLIFILQEIYFEIWKYDFKLEFFFFQKKVVINLYRPLLRYDINFIDPNEIIISTTGGTIFLDIDKNNNISIVCRVQSELYFCPFIYKKKYLLTKDGYFIYDLRKKRPIACSYLQLNLSCHTNNIILLSNGNLLLEYKYTDKDKNYLVEARIFENEIFLIKKIQLKYNFQIITQLKNGSIVIIKSK